MRQDLARITRLFYVHNGVRHLTLTTNGQQRERTVNEVCRMLDQNEDLSIAVSVSIDGLAATHDRLRGQTGSFDEALRCVRALEPVRDANERLRLNALSMITTETLEELRALAWNLLADFRLDGHYFEPVHGEPREPELGVVDPPELDTLLNDLEPIHRTYARRRGDGRGRLGTASSLTGIVTRHRLQRGVWETDRPSPLECTAGRTSIVVEHDGAVRACELRGVFANLRDFDMDFRALQASQVLAEEVDSILRKDCRCAQSRSIDESVRWSARGLLWELPRSYLSELIGRRRRASG
jgi:MoaA/NifB/PqqE/SkfB family radical SAM enzyme